MHPPHKKSLRVRLILVAISTLVSLVVMEVAARVFVAYEGRKAARDWEVVSTAMHDHAEPDAALGMMIRPSHYKDVIYEIKPDLDVKYVGKPVHTNSHGFRSEQYPAEKPPGAIRIVGLGDSVMFGHGVADDETFMSVLEQSLSEALPDIPVQVINTAAPGYNTAMEVALLMAKGLAHSPDIVLIDFVGNDMDLPNFISIPRNPLALDRSYLFELIRQRTREHEDGGSRPLHRAPMMEGNPFRFENVPERVPSQYRHMVGEAGYRDAMARLQGLSSQHGFELLVTSHENLTRFALDTCLELGIPLVPAWPFVEDYMKANGIERFVGSVLTVSKGDPHPTEVVHRIQGELLARYLLEFEVISRVLFQRLEDGSEMAAEGLAVPLVPKSVLQGENLDLGIELGESSDPKTVRAAALVVTHPPSSRLVIILPRESPRSFRLQIPSVQYAAGRYRLVPALQLTTGRVVRLSDLDVTVSVP